MNKFMQLRDRWFKYTKKIMIVLGVFIGIIMCSMLLIAMFQ